MFNRFDRLKFKQLSQFIAVAEAGSITEAAEILFMPQPALSRSIKDIETTLGDTRLFERTRKGVTLTSNGRKFLAFAQLVRSNFDAINSEMVRDDGKTGGLVRIGMGAYEGYTFLPEIIGRVMNRRPNVQFSFMSGKFQDLIGPLMHGKLDMIFGPVHAGALPKGAHSRIVAQAKPSVMVRANHPLANEESVTLKMLAAQEWVVPVSDTLPRMRFDEVFLNRALQPPVGPVEMSPSVFMIAILLQRDLVGLVHPQLRMLSGVSEALVELNMSSNPFRWPVQLTTVNRRHPSLAVHETINLIRSVLKGRADATT